MTPSPETRLPITLQMYTVREDAARDFAQTIETVAQIGYAGVELAGYGSAKSAAEARRILDDNGLIAVGAHVALDTLEGNLPQAIEDAQALGNEYITCPFLNADRRGSIAGYSQLGMILNEIGAKIKDAGLQLCYHNHDFEFETFGGETTGFDALYAASDPDLVQIELDVFWVKRAGLNPVDIMHKYRGRVPFLHIKDMTAGDKPTFAEVGEGITDFAPIFAAAPDAGTLFYVVEQDQCVNHAPLESVRISFENLKKMGMVG